MSKTAPRIATADSEIDAAIAQANVFEEFRPKAIAVTYRGTDYSITITLATGVELTIPRRLLQGLENATQAQLADVAIVGAQSGLHWEALDVDHYIPSLIEGIFGNRRWMSALGKIGGSARSAAKRAASQKNGRKGGRPKKKSSTP